MFRLVNLSAREARVIALVGLRKAERLAQLIDEKKGENVLILDVQGLCNFADYFVIGTGRSRLQLNAIGAHIEQTLKEQDGQRPVGREGQKSTSWIILDYGDVIAHLMTEDAREYYRLEQLWGDARLRSWAPSPAAQAQTVR
ncbi:MAG: hypothetical protein Kow0059_08380 [Candidatus Sumerlaeia bacterium]